MEEHDCGLDGEQRACVDGVIYGPCDHESCGGVCEYEAECGCPCHGGRRIQTVELPGVS